MKALLAFEDGRTFPCRSFTCNGEAGGEIVFNTGMTGYQEILTDPSYRGQMVTLTYPLVGNYGINPKDVESEKIQVSALLMREYRNFPSNHRSCGDLAAYLRRASVLGIDGLDTRSVALHIRKAGAMRALVSTEDLDPASIVLRARTLPKMSGQDLATGVTTEKPYLWSRGRRQFLDSVPACSRKWSPTSHGSMHRVVAFDFGTKLNILRCLEHAGCETLVVPSSTSADAVRAMAPNGIFLSNGPGDPASLDYAVNAIRDLLGQRPIFGICLGMQLLGLALGGKTFKLKFGHRGCNQPAKNLWTGRVEITSQNHGFAVDLESLADRDVERTHINLNDGTLEGFRHSNLHVLAVQYHREASAGPHDAAYLFDQLRKFENLKGKVCPRELTSTKSSSSAQARSS